MCASKMLPTSDDVAGGSEFSLQVLALGMPRTGTNSLCEAFDTLGLPCYHMYTLLANSKHADLWTVALDWKLFGKGSKPDSHFWKRLLGGYGAMTDLPGIIFFEEFLEISPSAKVVLVERDIEKWYTSFDTGIITPLYNPVANVITFLDPWYLGRIGGVSRRWCQGWFKAFSKAEMQSIARGKYREHYAHVRRLVPKDRLLEFDLKDGWGPLCEFLNRPVPKAPFPNTNNLKDLERKMRACMIKGLGNVFGMALLVLLTAWAVMFAGRS